MASEENLPSQRTFQHRKSDEDRYLDERGAFEVPVEIRGSRTTDAMSKGMFGERIIYLFIF